MKWLVLSCIPALATADSHSSAPVRDKRSMHWVDARNRHDEARVEVSFVDSKMVVTASGAVKEHSLSWANTWTGPFHIDADTMKAKLTLKDRTCGKTTTPRETAPCDPIDKVIEVHCIFYETPIETAPGTPKVEMLWSCTTENNIGETPLPWIFGDRPTCIEAVADRSGTTFKRCR